MQSAEADERLYHESLVQPSMLLHPNPKTVFVGGGGEGATIREILRHKSVEKCVMADIDGETVQVCKEHLKQHHDGAFEDPRLELVIDCAKKTLIESPISFDVIILDLADPVQGGPCYLLYTKSFYELAKSKLNPGGVLVTQSGPAGLTTHTEVLTPVNRTIREVFGEDNVHSYMTHIPSFTDLYAFTLARTEGLANPTSFEPEQVDKTMKERLPEWDSFHYDGLTHRNMFTLPKYARLSLAKEQHVITEDDPAFIYAGDRSDA
eukprot:TRINITY_DN2430_c0_g1_i1.p2 TRINITY_DN2430_c0_g1~~TRINITY_DN2430_c0_g1_i1.p2  ORF type:complete len:264 (+),score=59.28 TRINITY_DN2430_c0_g1_i1:181-972(+)